MRVMTYNLLHGGHDGTDDTRWRAQVEVINDVAPDVLLVQEAGRWDADGGAILFATEQAIGRRGFLAPAPRTGHHTVVFLRPDLRPSRFAIDDTHFHHALATVTVAAPGLADPLTVASFHLSPLHPTLRTAEVGWLASLAAPHRLAIIGGDANSLAPGDPEPDWSALLPHHRVRHLPPGSTTADRSPLAFLEAAGFVNAGAARGDITPTVPAAGFGEREFLPFRCDHLLLSPRLAPALTGYQVVVDDRTAHASDHLPVVIDLDPSAL